MSGSLAGQLFLQISEKGGGVVDSIAVYLQWFLPTLWGPDLSSLIAELNPSPGCSSSMD